MSVCTLSVSVWICAKGDPGRVTAFLCMDTFSASVGVFEACCCPCKQTGVRSCQCITSVNRWKNPEEKR